MVNDNALIQGHDNLPGAAHIVTFSDYDETIAVLGPHDTYLRIIERETGVVLTLRGTVLEIHGLPEIANRVRELLEDFRQLARQGHPITSDEILHASRSAVQQQAGPYQTTSADVLITTHRGKQIKPKSQNQRTYIDALRELDLVFVIGPAGTGKTYLAVAMAIAALNAKMVQRIILTRPAVEAGERLGFLPGDLAEKINPYLRPLYDALYDILDIDRVERLIEKKIIEIAPLAFMRGRTLNDAYIIMDEAQNTSPEQMKMLLTRLGYGSRAVVTGDVTQIDLPAGQRSGLIEARHILADVKGLRFISLEEEDVVRHPLVRRIVHAYEEATETPGERSR